MRKFYGKVGYGETVETSPNSDVWEDRITTRNYYGDVIRASRTLEEGDKVHDDLSLGNSISIVGDAYANNHIFNMRYIEWQGVRWKIISVEVQRPRLILSLGGVYNGPIPDESESTP